MLPKNQLELFEFVKRRFKNWSSNRTSGYVHGVADGYNRTEPQQIYIHKFKKKSEYAIGYIYGFIDCYGADALMTEWSRQLEISEKSLEYRWWDA